MFLAKGGMAEVYIGTHTTLHRSVAVKFLKADLQEDSELRERFEREARVIAMLRHPNIVQIFDFDSYQNQPYLVMEYVPGTSLGVYLRELHRRNERLDLMQVRNLLNKIASALNYAHLNNVVHRDVKPTNILLTSRSTPVSADQPLPEDVEPILTDFGLVRFTQSSTQTSTGAITGTPAYMSPEQARGDRVDTRTDVYSLGVTVYEMLAGRVPFEADSTMGVLHKQIYEPPPPIEGVSDRIREVLDRALEKDPNQRFQTPLEFAEAFEAALAGTTEAETMNVSFGMGKSITMPRPHPTSSAANRKRLLAYGIFGIVSVLAVLGTLTIMRMPASQKEASVTAIPALTEDHGHNAALTEPAPIPPEAPSIKPLGVLRFQDGSNTADQVTFSSGNLPPPPPDARYEAWLLADDGETLFSIGVITFNTDNRASLTFVDPAGRNLLTFYHGMQITIEPNPDNNPNPSNNVAFLALLPQGGFTHVRHLLSEFPSTPNQTPFMLGLRYDADLLNRLAQTMLTSFEAGEVESVRLTAEQMLNLIIGSQNPEYKDWNGNGAIDDLSDSFGLLLNGSNTGYIQGAFSHANLSRQSPDATENMLAHGEHVMIAVENVNGWTAQLRDQLIAVVGSGSLSEAESAIRQAVVLADQILNGVDINGNENIEAIPGEGGVVTAYEHAYYMADILLSP
jgi:serine/threonine protein kinase